MQWLRTRRQRIIFANTVVVLGVSLIVGLLLGSSTMDGYPLGLAGFLWGFFGTMMVFGLVVLISAIAYVVTEWVDRGDD